MPPTCPPSPHGGRIHISNKASISQERVKGSFLSQSLCQEQGQFWCGLEKAVKGGTPDGHSARPVLPPASGKGSHRGETDFHMWKGLPLVSAYRQKAA